MPFSKKNVRSVVTSTDSLLFLYLSILLDSALETSILMQRKTRCIMYIILAVPVIMACAVIEMHLHLLSSAFGTSLGETAPPLDASKPRETVVTYRGRLLETSTDTPIMDQRELDVLRMNGATQNLSQLNLHNMSYQQLLLTCHSYLDTASTICKRKLRMGKIGDGGWEICDDLEVRPKPPCIIYSFGIGNDFSFDDEAGKWYKCHVYSFDPTMNKQSYNRSYFVHVYNLGIADKTNVNKNGWKHFNFSDIRAVLGHEQSRINVVKMTVAGNEWNWLHEMVLSGQMNNVDQLLVGFIIVSLTHPDLLKALETLQSLELAGFRMFYTYKNEKCGYYLQGFPSITSRCFEVHYRRQ